MVTRAPPASSSSAKSSPAGPWYRQLSMWADVTSISRSASHTRPMSSRIRMASAAASPCRPSSIARSSAVRSTAIGYGISGIPSGSASVNVVSPNTDRSASTSDARYVVENTAENSRVSSSSCSIALCGTYGPMFCR